MSQLLLPRVAAGDRQAVQRLLEVYGGLVWALVRRFHSMQADAEDAAQDVFLELWSKAGRYDPAIGSEATFVSLVARRRLIDRSRRKVLPVDPSDLADVHVSPSSSDGVDSVDLRDDAARASLAFRSLQPDQQRVLRLAIFDELSHDQIAQATQLPLRTVRMHVRGGLAKIRQLLGVETRRRTGGDVADRRLSLDAAGPRRLDLRAARAALA